MDSSELMKQLSRLPENQRTELANHHTPLLESLDEIEYILELLPTSDRPEFLRKHLNRIKNSYLFSVALDTLSEESRLEFANQNYAFFPLVERQRCKALANILRILPEKERFDFACQHANEIEKDHVLIKVLQTIPQPLRFEFARPFLAKLFFGCSNTLEMLKILLKNECLNFYLNSKGDYLSQDRLAYALTLIPQTDASHFLEKNTHKMLASLETLEPIDSAFFDVKHPIYYSLQMAFNAIETDSKDDQQKSRIYSEVSDFFNSRYTIHSEPYNPLKDIQYFYLRDLEFKAISSLIKTKTPLSASISELITQYSGHYIDLAQCQARALELKQVPSDDLTWKDLIFLHKNTLGLRGVTDDDMAVNEAKNGGRGDAVSLARFGMGKEKDLPFTVLVNEAEMDISYPQKKAELLKLFQEGIKWHIKSCFGFGYSVAFELISRGEAALYPYDFGDTYHLGKCGTDEFNASQVKKTILRADAPDWNVESVYRFILAEIKQLKKMQEPPQHYSPRLFVQATALPEKEVKSQSYQRGGCTIS